MYYDLMVMTTFWTFVQGLVIALGAAYGLLCLYVWFNERSK